jgi:hypothetical protein
VSGVDIINGTGVGVGWGLLAGFPIGRLKPHLRLGFIYNYTKDSVAKTTLQDFEIAPTVGIDFLAAEHFLFGVDALSFDVVVWGDAKSGFASSGFGGHDIAFFNAFRVAYVF